MKKSLLPRTLLWIACAVVCTPALIAQNSIQLFGPVNVRNSQAGAGYGSAQVIFNSNTLNLTCPATPYAVLSSSNVPSPPAGSGNVLVDNNINVSNLTAGTGPTNVCSGGVNGSSIGPFENCFQTAYQTPASNNQLDGVNPDTIVSTGGVPPIDISSQLIAGTQQIKIDLVDEGGKVASSSLYLNTNCTNAGVNGPAQITGNNIPPSGATNTQLDQDFNFNPTTNQLIGFEYDLTAANSANSLTVDPNGAIPQVGDSALDPLAYPGYVTGTSFATSMCLVHDGELLNGNAACKLFTLECTNGTGSTASGAQCPISSLPNETLRDVFDGPTFTLPDITNGSGTTFHQGMGFLMASEGWTGSPCTFDPASGLQDLPCPQNLLTSFTGPGTFSTGGQTTHPNSTFITVAQVPEDLTTVQVTDSQGNPVALGGGTWVNSSSPYIKFTTQPPDLTGSGVANASNFVASPIVSLTYGVSSGSIPPAPGTTTDTVLTDSQGCGGAAAAFTPTAVQLSNLPEGTSLVHYYAKDCAGTQELLFLKDGSGSWSTNFYTYPINVDTIVPVVSSGPTLSPAGPYYSGQMVTAKFECTDERSGIVSCGGKSFASTGDTGLQTVTFAASGSGSQNFTVNAADAAGNTSNKSASYSVNVDSQVQLSISPNTVVYPLGTNVTVQVAAIAGGKTPTGSVKITDGGTTITTLNLSSGAAYYYLKGLSAGSHTLNAVYSGDKNNVAGTSASVILTVQPVPVALVASCWNTPYPYGSNFQCTVNASSNAGAPLGVITYSYDGGSPVSLTLSSGAASVVIPKPPVGNHSLVISYPAQTNYAASGPVSKPFVVTAAPVVVQFTPSTWYATSGNLKLTATVQSSYAGAPSNNGIVTFTRGATVLGSQAVNASGVATITIPVSSLPNGNDQLTATYSGGTNYATGSTTITVQVAH